MPFGYFIDSHCNWRQEIHLDQHLIIGFWMVREKPVLATGMSWCTDFTCASCPSYLWEALQNSSHGIKKKCSWPQQAQFSNYKLLEFGETGTCQPKTAPSPDYHNGHSCKESECLLAIVWKSISSLVIGMVGWVDRMSQVYASMYTILSLFHGSFTTPSLAVLDFTGA